MTLTQRPRRATQDGPRIAIITALPVEYSAVDCLLENSREARVTGQGAGRRYKVGHLPAADGGVHKVVLGLAGTGNNVAAARAALVLERFPSVRHVLMVGIAGGIPDPTRPERHVRLGDVVVSSGYGVTQYDFVKRTAKISILRSPPRPPNAELLEAAHLCEITHGAHASYWHDEVASGLKRYEIKRPLPQHDILVDIRGKRIRHPRDPLRRSKVPRIFIGGIASANTLLKDPGWRDSLRDQYGVMAVEMEGAGIADATWEMDAGYMVIRGICDYCDENKNDVWHAYAATVGAAFCRFLLRTMAACMGDGFSGTPSQKLNVRGLANVLPPKSASVLRGRKNEVRALSDFLASDQLLCWVTGLGGIGKTALVADWAHRLVRRAARIGPIAVFYFTGVPGAEGELRADRTNEGRRGGEFWRAVAKWLGVAYLSRLGDADLRQAVAERLEALNRILIIIDNWESIQGSSLLVDLKRLPQNVNVVICRESPVAETATILRLGPLATMDARQVIRDLVTRSAIRTNIRINKQLIEKAAELSGNVPLLLSLLAPHVSAGVDSQVLEVTLFRRRGGGRDDLCERIVGRFWEQVFSDHSAEAVALEVLALHPRPALASVVAAIVTALGYTNVDLERLVDDHIVTRVRAGIIDKGQGGRLVLHTIWRRHIIGVLKRQHDQWLHLVRCASEYYARRNEGFLLTAPRENPRGVLNYRIIDADADNMLSLIRSAIDVGDREHALRLIISLGYYFRVSERWVDGEEYWSLGSDLAREAETPEGEELARRFSMYVWYLRLFRGQPVETMASLEKLYETMFGQRSLLALRGTGDYTTASLARLLGLVARHEGQYATAIRWGKEAQGLMQQLASAPGVSRVLNDLGDTIIATDTDAAEGLLQSALREAAGVGDRIEVARAQRLLGDCQRQRNNITIAAMYYRECLRTCDEIGLPDERFCANYGLLKLGAASGCVQEVIDKQSQRAFGPLIGWLDARPPRVPLDVVRLVVLDWSGVLANDLRLTHLCQIEVLRKLKAPLVTELEFGTWAKTVQPDMRALFRGAFSPQAAQEAINLYESTFAKKVPGCTLRDEAVGLVKTLKRRGYRIALYSSQVGRIVWRDLDKAKLLGVFDVVLTADELNDVKPSERHLAMILEAVGVGPHESIIVDDMDEVLRVGRAAGFITVCCRSPLTRGSGDWDSEVPSLEALLECIENLDKRTRR